MLLLVIGASVASAGAHAAKSTLKNVLMIAVDGTHHCASEPALPFLVAIDHPTAKPVLHCAVLAKLGVGQGHPTAGAGDGLAKNAPLALCSALSPTLA